MILLLNIDSISVERLLVNWGWLCPGTYELADINDFGDLFLVGRDGGVSMLDLQGGELNRIAESVEAFEKARLSEEKRREWYFEDISNELRGRGFRLLEGKVFGYKTSPVFAESVQREDNIYLADLYEYVSYMGTLQGDLKDLPEGTKVRLKVKES